MHLGQACRAQPHRAARLPSPTAPGNGPLLPRWLWAVPGSLPRPLLLLTLFLKGLCSH